MASYNPGVRLDSARCGKLPLFHNDEGNWLEKGRRRGTWKQTVTKVGPKGLDQNLVRDILKDEGQRGKGKETTMMVVFQSNDLCKCWNPLGKVIFQN